MISSIGMGRGVACALPIVLLAGFALAAAPALGVDHAVKATSNTFTPATVTINQGDSVTWNNAGGSHNVRFDDDSFVQPSPPNSSIWTVTRTFAAPASLRYHCEIHGGAGGVGMSGRVVVNAPGSPPPGGTPPGSSPPAQVSPLSDTAAPILTLGVRSAQRVLRRRSLLVSVRSGEEATLTVAGTIAVPKTSRLYRLRTVRRKIAPNLERKLELELPARTLTAVRRALRRGTRLAAKLTVSARDRAGNVRSLRRKVRLRP